MKHLLLLSECEIGDSGWGWASDLPRGSVLLVVSEFCDSFAGNSMIVVSSIGVGVVVESRLNYVQIA